ncbi:hypothetical protein [Nocardia sp. NPDC050175]|uniref:hypothetical protein n=1 Tax=Nocardia sp. NPDC050175 TaxID=3364317 RepID=UPI00378FADAD
MAPALSRRIVGTLNAVLAVLLVGGCGTQDHSVGPEWSRVPELTYLSDFPVENELTDAVAQQRSVAHLVATARALPDRLRFELARTPDIFSCVFDPKAVDPPLRVMTSYAIPGTQGREYDYLKSFESTWRSFGWSTKFDQYDYRTNYREPAVVKADSADHYTLIAQFAENGGVTVYTTSPCFPHDRKVGTSEPPAVIQGG